MVSGLVIPGDMVEKEDTIAWCHGHAYRYTPPSGGKARMKRKTVEKFYKGYGEVYLPGDIKGLTDILHLLLAEFLAGNTVRNQLVYVLDALLRLNS